MSHARENKDHYLFNDQYRRKRSGKLDTTENILGRMLTNSTLHNTHPDLENCVEVIATRLVNRRKQPFLEGLNSAKELMAMHILELNMDDINVENGVRVIDYDNEVTPLASISFDISTLEQTISNFNKFADPMTENILELLRSNPGEIVEFSNELANMIIFGQPDKKTYASLLIAIADYYNLELMGLLLPEAVECIPSSRILETIGILDTRWASIEPVQYKINNDTPMAQQVARHVTNPTAFITDVTNYSYWNDLGVDELFRRIKVDANQFQLTTDDFNNVWRHPGTLFVVAKKLEQMMSAGGEDKDIVTQLLLVAEARRIA